MSKRLVAGGIGLAVLASAFVGWYTGSPAVLGVTPAGIAIYLLIGVAGPQYVLARRRDDPMALGLAILAGVGGLLALLDGVLFRDFHGQWDLGLSVVLAIVVFGILGGAVVRAFREGYRGTTA